MSLGELRAIGIGVLAVALLLVIVPFHYWGVLAAVLKAVALGGTAVLMIRGYLRRRH